METGFLNSLMSGAQTVGTNIANFATDLFKNGSWLKTAFSGENASTTLDGLSKGFDAYSKYDAAKSEDKLNDQIFGLQKEQYKDYLTDKEDEKKRIASIDNSLGSIWGS